jgi:hypothetical protein
MPIFDSIRDFFSDLFGGDDSEEDDDFSWGGVGGDDSTGWGGDFASEEFSELGDMTDRVIDNPGSGEFVQTFYDINSLMEYLEGTPESVLQFEIDDEYEAFHVYRFDS